MDMQFRCSDFCSKGEQRERTPTELESRIKTIKFDFNDRIKTGTKITPAQVVKDQIDLIDQSIFDSIESTIFDPVCKSGIYLETSFWRYWASEEHRKNYVTYAKEHGLRTEERWRSKWILKYQLFGLAASYDAAQLCRRLLYGDGHIYIDDELNMDNYPIADISELKNYDTGSIDIPWNAIDLMQEGSKDKNGNTIKSGYSTYKYLIKHTYGVDIEEENLYTFNEQEDCPVKFDVVVGNPPYNDGIDIDFVRLSFELSKKYVVMITPAKWQTAETANKHNSEMTYEQFRRDLVPHMSKVVFYPCARDVFDIRCNSGITYYIMDKHLHSECVIENRWGCFPEYYNSEVKRSIRNGETLCNIGNELLEYMGVYTKLAYIRQKKSSMEYCVWGTSAMPMFLDYKPNTKIQHYMTSDLKVCKSEDIKKEPLSNDSFIFFESNNKDECKSFRSYMYAKLVRFMLTLNISIYKGWNQAITFKYVPAPPSGKFDHIYTDEELYKEFNIPQKYIDVIEAIIKKRD